MQLRLVGYGLLLSWLIEAAQILTAPGLFSVANRTYYISKLLDLDPLLLMAIGLIAFQGAVRRLRLERIVLPLFLFLLLALSALHFFFAPVVIANAATLYQKQAQKQARSRSIGMALRRSREGFIRGASASALKAILFGLLFWLLFTRSREEMLQATPYLAWLIETGNARDDQPLHPLEEMAAFQRACLPRPLLWLRRRGRDAAEHDQEPDPLEAQRLEATAWDPGVTPPLPPKPRSPPRSPAAPISDGVPKPQPMSGTAGADALPRRAADEVSGETFPLPEVEEDEPLDPRLQRLQEDFRLRAQAHYRAMAETMGWQPEGDSETPGAAIPPPRTPRQRFTASEDPDFWFAHGVDPEDVPFDGSEPLSELPSEQEDPTAFEAAPPSFWTRLFRRR